MERGCVLKSDIEGLLAGTDHLERVLQLHHQEQVASQQRDQRMRVRIPEDFPERPQP